MLPQAICPGQTFPREWKLYLWVKRRKMDEMSLEEFLKHWDVNRHELAIICECSKVTVDFWFAPSSPRQPTQKHLRRLAEAHRELTRMCQEPARFRQIYQAIEERSRSKTSRI